MTPVPSQGWESSPWAMYTHLTDNPLNQNFQTFWHWGPVLWKIIFPQTWQGAGDGLGMQMHCKCIAFIVHFISIIITSAHLKSSGIISQRLGTPTLNHMVNIQMWGPASDPRFRTSGSLSGSHWFVLVLMPPRKYLHALLATLISLTD